MAKIEENEDGPLTVRNVSAMQGPDGNMIEVKEVMTLCRCGRSSNKPFCDGTHRAAGFKSRTDNEASGKDSLRRYEGGDVTVLYNPRICSHAAECIATAPKSFDPDQKPWIDPDKSPADVIRAAVAHCPSGALQLAEGGHIVDTELPPIIVQRDGPYRVTGVELGLEVPGEGGTPEKYVLCRCGLSGNKPYCDGSHHGKKWKSGD